MSTITSQGPRAALSGLAALALVGALACSEASPGGDELMSHAEREAVPLSEEGLDATKRERKEERLEEYGVGDPAGDAG
jgi:hypothetical protein